MHSETWNMRSLVVSKHLSTHVHMQACSIFRKKSMQTISQSQLLLLFLFFYFFGDRRPTQSQLLHSQHLWYVVGLEVNVS